ncbi:MAG: SPOR domain-containing protein, partial [Pseudomonadota bacterium]|nr:SPOR domain-containing protein [Pseudomonadota bacterium]
ALQLGDTQAAAGFFGRAEEISPTAFAPKIGMGATSAVMGDPRGALIWFAQAQRLGASNAALGAHRGLAQDLLGNQVAAQNDYRAALAGPDRDEARRRLALSLAISRDIKGGIAMLQPLLNRRDPGAQRARAFILALGGDRAGARSAIDSAMPGSSARIDPFFMVLPSLSVDQKAAAVHLGVFPTATEMRLATATPLPPAYPVARATRALPPAPQTRAPAPQVPVAMARPAERVPIEQPATSSIISRSTQAQTVEMVPVPSSLPTIAARAVPPPASFEMAANTQPDVAADSVSVTPPPSAPVTDVAAVDLPAATRSEGLAPAPGFAGLDRLSGIDDVLGRAGETAPPPAPKPKFELVTPPAPQPKYELATLAPVDADVPASDTGDGDADQKAADAKKVAAKKAGDAKKVAAKKIANAKKTADAKKMTDAKKLADARKAAAKAAADEKEEREALGVAGTNWVQLAGGANSDRMKREFDQLAAKSSTLKKRGGHVTQGKDYFRLLTGPFDSKSEAQSFVNQLAKDDVDGFSWTRTPASIKIEKLPPK